MIVVEEGIYLFNAKLELLLTLAPRNDRFPNGLASSGSHQHVIGSIDRPSGTVLAFIET